MRFGPTPVDEAAGATLAHALVHGGLTFRKGRVLSAADVPALHAAGIAHVITARLDPDDMGEDAAAAALAAPLTGPGITTGAAFTGRVNLFAAAAGLFLADAARIDAVNAVDEAVTVATLPAFTPVAPGQMVATVKIIPFAAPRAAVGRAVALMGGESPLTVAAFRPLRASLIQTRLPGTKAGTLDKTVGVTAARLSALGGVLAEESRCPHDAEALAAAIAAALAGQPDLLLIAGASAITDRRDVLPAAVERVGGVVEHFGMPVDPGNLILLARAGGVPVLGLPGCARSPKLNGFDWVLQRFAAGVPVGRRDIMGMGVGGLLAEIPSRPLPRLSAVAADGPVPRAPRIAALVLAAGRSTRMNGVNKLLADVDGMPMIARTVDAVLASHARPVVVVTGHQPDGIRAALAGRNVALVHNPAFAEGLSTSLRAGLAAVPADCDGVLVCLGDMPQVTAAAVNRLIAAYNPTEGRAICVPTADGKRGNPVLWDRGFFTDMAAVAGDTGARHLLGEYADRVCEVPMDGDGVLTDVDTVEGLARLTGST